MLASRDLKDLYAHLGILLGVPAFLTTWWFFISDFGLVIGLGLGWLPALAVAIVFAIFWPVALALVLLSAMADRDFLRGSAGDLAASIGTVQAIWIAVIVLFVGISALANAAIAVENWSQETRNRKLAVAAIFPLSVVALFAIVQFAA